jgi:predicted transposase/invertase (TIGR01784 family)
LSYDNACKYLAERYPGEFARWLLEIEPPEIRVLKTELIVEPIRADSLSLLRAANRILHLEFQTLPVSKPPLPLRMLDYSVRLKRKYGCSVEQVVIFLQETTNEVAFTEEYRDETTIHRYRVVRLWEQDSALFLANPALLPLAVLTQSSSPQALLQEVAEQVASIEDIDQRQNIASCAGVLAGLRFEEDVIRQLFREDMMQGSVIYQSIRQEGKQEGKQEGLQEGLKQEALTIAVRLLRRRFGEMETRITAKVQALSRKQLEELIENLLDFSKIEDLEAWLEQQQQREREVNLIVRQLNRRLGEVEPALIERVRGLPIAQLEALGEALLDFSEVADLVAWLQPLQQEE